MHIQSAIRRPQRRCSLPVVYTVGTAFILLAAITHAQPGPAEGERSRASLSIELEANSGSAWDAWALYYSTLDSFLQQAPGIEADSLRGLAPQEINAVVQAGKDFLIQLRELEDDARRELLRYYPLSDAVPLPPLPPEAASREVILLPRGQTLQEALQATGIADGLEERKRRLLESHQEYLRQLIGTANVERLERHILDVVAPSVRKYKADRRISLQ